MAEAIDFLLLAWLAWIAGCVLLLLASAFLLPKPEGWAHFDGFRVVVPDGVRAVLTPSELRALVEHEEGHRALGHVWANLWRVCMLRPATRAELMGQEMAADDCATDRAALASAIRKLSRDEFDLWRADRLEVEPKPGGMPGETARE